MSLISFKHLRRTLTHRTVILWTSGYVLIVAMVAVGSVVEPEKFSRFSYGLLATMIGIPVGGFVSATYGLVAGRWGVRTWRRIIFFVFPPVPVLLAYFTITVPDYSTPMLIIVLGGLLMLLGIYERWQMMLLGCFFGGALISMTVFLKPEADALTFFRLCITGVFLLAFMFYLSITSNYITNQDNQVKSLLRASRKDKRIIEEERKKSESLLLNILPKEIAGELKKHGSSEPRYYDDATILFTDFKGFTHVAESLPPNELVKELDRCFSYFDSLMDRYHLEKLKTIGDSYMCAGGIPLSNKTHAVDCVLAAFEIQSFMNQMKEIKSEQGLPYWELRLGISSGPVVAGVIGEKKFAYDVWSDTVNTASRMESSGEPGRINISGQTHALVRDFFVCEYRGKVPAKNKGEVEMYFVTGIRPELSRSGDGKVPNEAFRDLYTGLQGGDPATAAATT